MGVLRVGHEVLHGYNHWGGAGSRPAAGAGRAVRLLLHWGHWVGRRGRGGRAVGVRANA